MRFPVLARAHREDLLVLAPAAPPPLRQRPPKAQTREEPMDRAAFLHPNMTANFVLATSCLRAKLAPELFLWQPSAAVFSNTQGTRDAESIIRVAKLRWNAGTRRAARNLNMVPPR